VETIPTIEVEVSKIQPIKVEPQIKLVEEVKIAKPALGTKPLVYVQVDITKTIVEKPNV